MSKPLSAEWNSVIQRFMEGENTRAMLAAAIDEAAFWRSAVRDADVCGVIGAPCPWCEAYTTNAYAAVHATDCKHLLAVRG